MAEVGTGTPGANQNGPVNAPSFSPGEVVTAAGPASRNAPAPLIDITLGSHFITTAYDLVTRGPLRSELIFDQFATVRPSNVTHRGGSVRMSFTDDIPVQTTPLLENIDVDSVSFGAKGVILTQLPYGTAVTTTDILQGTSMIAIDPVVGEKVGYNAGASMDSLAHTALLQTQVDYDDGSHGHVAQIGSSSTYFDGYMLQEALEQLRSSKVRPINGGYVAVISPRQVQQIMSDTSTLGWRKIVSEMEGGGNSIYRGEVGTFEGVRIVMNNALVPGDKGFVMGAEAFAKMYPNAPGFGPQPRTVVAPVNDKLRRFASVGWYHMVGYSIFRPEALIHITSSSALRPRPTP
jgi:N4-gp56 family major capsid protein